VRHGYAAIYDVVGEVTVHDKSNGVFVWEVRPDIKRWAYVDANTIKPLDQPPLHEIARFFEEFWTSGEPIPASNGLYGGAGQRLEVLNVRFSSDRLRVTLRPVRLRT